MRKILLIVATFLLVVACSKDDVNEPKEPKPSLEQIEKNFPFLKVGHSWTYKYGSGHKNTYTFNEIIFFRGYAIYRFETDSLRNWYEFLATDSTVLLSAMDNLLFKESYTVGEKWPNLYTWPLYGTPGTISYITREVVSINETITVEAGTFEDCIKIREIIFDAYDVEIDNRTYWLRNDIGIIKYKFETSGWIFYELKSKNF